MAIVSVLLMTVSPFPPAGDAAAAFTKVDGREALLRSVELFLNRDGVKQIQLVVSADHFDEVKSRHGAHLGFSGVKLLSAAPRLADQLAAGAAKLIPEATHVLVHDAARPAVPYFDIDTLIAAAEGKAAATALSISPRGSLAELDEGGTAVGFATPGRFVEIVPPVLLTRQKFIEVVGKKEIHAADLTLTKGSPLNVRVGSAEAAYVKAMLSMLPRPKAKPASSPFEEAQW
jgi:hypothetical protein